MPKQMHGHWCVLMGLLLFIFDFHLTFLQEFVKEASSKASELEDMRKKLDELFRNTAKCYTYTFDQEQPQLPIIEFLKIIKRFMDQWKVSLAQLDFRYVYMFNSFIAG